MQGCGPIGLMVLAVLRTLGIDKIIAVDGNDNRLELAKEMGATATFNFTKYASFDDMLAEIRKESDGLGAGFVFQCTGVPAAAANAWKMVRRGGGPLRSRLLPAERNLHDRPALRPLQQGGYGGRFVGLLAAGLPDRVRVPAPCGRNRPAMEKLVTHHIPLDRIQEALEVNVNMQGIKVAVIVD